MRPPSMFEDDAEAQLPDDDEDDSLTAPLIFAMIVLYSLCA